MFTDSLGSGDDDEDNGLEDSSAEIENDQVYFSRGVLIAEIIEELVQLNLKVLNMSNRWSLSIQVPIGPTLSVWRRSCMLFLLVTQ